MAETNQLWLTLVVLGMDAASWSIPTGESVMIGRDESVNDLVLHHPEVSRTHARISERHGSYVIADLGSKCGLFVNDHPIRNSRKLSHGDIVKIGPYSLKMAIRPWRYRDEDELDETLFEHSSPAD